MFGQAHWSHKVSKHFISLTQEEEGLPSSCIQTSTRNRAGVRDSHKYPGLQTDPWYIVAAAKMNNIGYSVYTWPAVCIDTQGF
jgi:hypothetical protein